MKDERKIIISSIDELENTNKKDKSTETKVLENHEEKKEFEYKLPNLNIITNKKSSSFVNLYKELNSKNDIMIPIGTNKDKIICEELNLMPNMLIGGTVMSGKTTYIHSIISSILMTQKPNDIKLVIFDSKKVEYSMYNGIPHLLAPIITDSKKLLNALRNISK